MTKLAPFRENPYILPVREKNPILDAVRKQIDDIKSQISIEDFNKKDIKSIQSDDILNFIFNSYKHSKKDLVHHLEKIYHYHSFAFNQAREALLNIFSSLFLTIIQTYHPEYRRQHMRCIFNLLLFAVLSIHFFAASIYIYKTLTIFSIICSVGLVSALLLTFHRYQSINHFFNNIAHKLASTFVDQIKNNLTPSRDNTKHNEGLTIKTTFPKPPCTATSDSVSDSVSVSDSDSDSDSDKTDKESNEGSPPTPFRLLPSPPKRLTVDPLSVHNVQQHQQTLNGFFAPHITAIPNDNKLPTKPNNTQ